MTAPEVGRRRDGTATGNELVPLVLGLMRLLDRVAAAAAATSPAPAARAASAGDDAVLAALLGVLSVRRTLRRWLEAGALEAEHAERGASVPPPSRGSWLR